MVSIRRASVDDAERVGLFQTLTWEQTYRGIVPDAFLDARSVSSATDRWAERIGAGSRLVLVAESPEGQTIGVASTSRSSSDSSSLPSLELCTLYVIREAQSTAVASSLLGAALNEEDAHLLVFSFNKRAQHFYARHGFERRGERQRDPGTGLHEERWVRQTGGPSQ